jgi:hypothetical protein
MTLLVSTHTSPSPDVVVLALSGTPAADVLALVADGVAELTAAGQTVVLGLDDLVMTRAAVMRGFLARLLGKSVQGRIVLQCGRRSGRQVLRRWTTDELAIVSALTVDHEPALRQASA